MQRIERLEAGEQPQEVGGAALTEKFTRLRIAPKYNGMVGYARDAMTGLDLANQIAEPDSRAALSAKLDERTRVLQADAAAPTTPVDAPQIPGIAPVVPLIVNHTDTPPVPSVTRIGTATAGGCRISSASRASITAPAVRATLHHSGGNTPFSSTEMTAATT